MVPTLRETIAVHVQELGSWALLELVASQLVESAQMDINILAFRNASDIHIEAHLPDAGAGGAPDFEGDEAERWNEDWKTQTQHGASEPAGTYCYAQAYKATLLIYRCTPFKGLY